MTIEISNVAAEAAMRREVESALSSGKVRNVCQPIVSLRTGEVVGYESLARPSCPPPLDTPDAFLAVASRMGLLTRTDELWRNSGVARFSPLLPPESLLFLNVTPASLTSGHFQPLAGALFMARHGLAPERVVLEVTETEAIVDYNLMRRKLNAFRSHGFLVAIDDAGAGQSSLQSTVELRPHFIKLDRWLTKDIAIDQARRSMVEAMVGFAHRMRARVVAEGIETVDQLKTFVELGVDYAQGYLLGRPEPIPALPPPHLVRLIIQVNNKRRDAVAQTGSARVGDMAFVSPTVGPEDRGSEIMDIFEANDLLDAVVVTDQGQPAGVMTRARLVQKLSGNFGVPLNGRRPAIQLCSPATIVDASQTARSVARIALQRPPAFQHDPVVVVNGREFAGIVGITDLLQQLLAEEVAEARMASPLTGLPGNRRIRAYIEANFHRAADLIFLYADIDNFKGFNDRCGFAYGDVAIARLGSVLESVASRCDGEAFVGHVGGDDFVLVISGDDVGFVEAALGQAFVDGWFDPAGALGEAHLGVTVGGAALSEFAHLSYEEMGAAVARLKSELKRRGGDCFVIFDRADFPGAELAA